MQNFERRIDLRRTVKARRDNAQITKADTVSYISQQQRVSLIRHHEVIEHPSNCDLHC